MTENLSKIFHHMKKEHPEKAEIDLSTFFKTPTGGAMKGVQRKICEYCQRHVWYPNHSESDCKLYGNSIIKLPKKEGYQCKFCLKKSNLTVMFSHMRQKHSKEDGVHTEVKTLIKIEDLGKKPLEKNKEEVDKSSPGIESNTNERNDVSDFNEHITNIHNENNEFKEVDNLSPEENSESAERKIAPKKRCKYCQRRFLSPIHEICCKLFGKHIKRIVREKSVHFQCKLCSFISDWKKMFSHMKNKHSDNANKEYYSKDELLSNQIEKDMKPTIEDQPRKSNKCKYCLQFMRSPIHEMCCKLYGKYIRKCRNRQNKVHFECQLCFSKQSWKGMFAHMKSNHPEKASKEKDAQNVDISNQIGKFNF